MIKTEIIKKNYQFRKVLTRGKFFTQKNIEIVVLKNNLKINLLGIAVSTKNGKSFLRNKAKRLIRESYRNLEPQMIEGNSIVILIRKGTNIKQLKYKDVFDAMKICFYKANILKKEEEK